MKDTNQTVKFCAAKIAPAKIARGAILAAQILTVWLVATVKDGSTLDFHFRKLPQGTYALLFTLIMDLETLNFVEIVFNTRFTLTSRQGLFSGFIYGRMHKGQKAIVAKALRRV